MTVKYTLGINSFSKETNNYQEILEKQINLPVPLITGALVHKNKKEEQKIYVGKEINLHYLKKDNYWIKKYDLLIDDLVDLVLNGYTRACLLNYKKYDQIVVGVKESDIIVPDYYALRRKLNEELKEMEG